jgi:GNAT superfamily N-acetyltransferase
MIDFRKTTIEEQLEAYRRYTATLRLVDTFWEDNIMQSQIYSILFDGVQIGCMSIDETELLLTSFFLDTSYLKHAQSVFQVILKAFQVKYAYVVTNDELFLSLCMDYQVKVENQAYFFDDIMTPKIPPAYPKTYLKQATKDDELTLAAFDFFDNIDTNCDEDVKYLLRDEQGTLLGAGHIQTMLLAPQWGACGMVTAEEHRQKGVGRSIILHLKEICKQKGLIPIAGCWYYNHNSKKTLESCGFASATRLLKVHF